MRGRPVTYIRWIRTLEVRRRVSQKKKKKKKKYAKGLSSSGYEASEEKCPGVE
jgi:hypothetical protein